MKPSSRGLVVLLRFAHILRMLRSFTIGLPVAAAIALSGCTTSSDSRSDMAARIIGQPPQSKAPPTPDSPENAVLAFKWCWQNRDVTNYRDLFTGDFRFDFSQVDSAGEFYRTTPWTREDELISARNLFVSGSATQPPAVNIALIFTGAVWADPDNRPGKEEPWHQQIQIPNLTLTITRPDGSGLQVTGGALFYLVRGDSALVPSQLREHGIGADSQRWYIERWEDRTTFGSPNSAEMPAATPARALPSTKPTWGSIKTLYR